MEEEKAKKVESTAIDPPAEINPPENREALIQQAVNFLNSNQARNAETKIKIDFLKQKGLSENEINIALERSDNQIKLLPPVIKQTSVSTLSTPPIVPPRPLNQHVSSFQQIPRKSVLQDVVLSILVLGGSSLAIFAVVKKLLTSSFIKFVERYTEFINDRKSKVGDFIKKVLKYCQVYEIKKEPLPPPPNPEPESPQTPSLPLLLTKNLTTATTKFDLLKTQTLALHQKIEQSTDTTTTAPSALKELKQSVEQLSQICTQETYFQPAYSGYFKGVNLRETEVSKAHAARIGEIRDGIRAVKGVLLSRKFPM